MKRPVLLIVFTALFLPVSEKTKIFHMSLNYLNPGFTIRCINGGVYTCYQIENVWKFALWDLLLYILRKYCLRIF